MSTAQTATQVKQAITDYYSNPTVWDEWSTMIQANPGLSEQAIYEAIQQYQAEQTIEIMQSASGRVLGYGYGQSIPTVDLDSNVNNFINSMDSNISKAEYAINDTINTRINPSIFKDAQTGDITMKSGAFKVDSTTGTVSTVATVADKVSLGVVGVNLGAKLGRWIDETIYNSDPEFWDKTFPTINPQTWDTIASTQGGKSFIRTLFGIENNTATAYVDEDVLAYTYQLLRDMGLLESSPEIEPQGGVEPNTTITPEFITGRIEDICRQVFGAPLNPNLITTYGNKIGVFGYDMAGTPIIFFDWNNDIIMKSEITIQSEYSSANIYITSGGIYDYSPSSSGYGMLAYPAPAGYGTPPGYVGFAGSGTSLPSSVANGSPVGFPGIASIALGTAIPKTTMDIPGGTQYPADNITGTTPQQVKQQLKNTYPDLFNDSIKETVLQPDGSIEEITYVPIPWVIETTDPNPETELQTLTSPITDPSTTATDQSDPEVSDNTLPQIINNPTSPTPQTNPDTGTGSSPIVEPITGSASSLWAVYNPTQQQVNDFGAWLWSSDFVEQIKKLFLDPMQAIIGIHKVFVTPSTSGTATIKCGYLDSNVSAKVVSDQYKTVDCGTVSLPEYFGNVFDYEPFTSVKCFLPFIGIVPLDVSFIMRSKINIKYKVDVFTGACLAEIKISRDGHKNIIYTYSGSAIVTYPVSSGSYAGVISSVIQAAMGVAMGSPTTVVSGILSAHADTSVNGSFSGCAGAMGGKIPYLIISRPQTRMARNVNNFIGLGANYTTEIQYCKGFFKVLDVHLHIEGAYDSEVNEILSLLKTGVLTDSEYDGFYYEPQVSDIEGITITENGRYTADGVIRGYNPITVNVSPTLMEKSITANGDYLAEDDDVEGYSKVSVNVPMGTLIEKTFTVNGEYLASNYSAYGFSKVIVDVAGGGGASIEDIDYVTFINTPIVLPILLTSDIYTYTDFMVVNSAMWQTPSGAYDTASSGNLTWNRIIVDPNNNTIYFGNGTKNGQVSYNITVLNTRHIAEFNKNGNIEVDNNIVSAYTATTPSNNVYLCVGGSYFTTQGNPYTGRIYGYKAIDISNNTVLCDLKPVKITIGNSVIYALQDIINSVIYPIQSKAPFYN